MNHFRSTWITGWPDLW